MSNFFVNIDFCGLPLTVELHVSPADPGVGYMHEEIELEEVRSEANDDLSLYFNETAIEIIEGMAIAKAKAQANDARVERQLDAVEGWR